MQQRVGGALRLMVAAADAAGHPQAEFRSVRLHLQRLRRAHRTVQQRGIQPQKRVLLVMGRNAVPAEDVLRGENAVLPRCEHPLSAKSQLGEQVALERRTVGKNQTGLREEACKNLEYLGIKINKEVNDKVRGEEAIISTDDSKVKVVVVPTDEEIVIARDTMELVANK